MFLLKKTVSQFLFPMPFALGLALVGLILLWFSKRQRAGKILTTIGVLLLLILGYGQVSGRALASLERFHPVQPLQLDEQATDQDVAYIVVLSGGHSSDPSLPVTSQLSPETLARTVEGVRLYRQCPNSKLLLSGGGAYDAVPEAFSMARLAANLGVPHDDILLEPGSNDTKDQARVIKGMIGNSRFLLVTSASHMRRSVALFQQQGLSPVPAPTEHQVKACEVLTPGAFFPNAGDLWKARRAAYEYLGIIWGRLRGLL